MKKILILIASLAAVLGFTVAMAGPAAAGYGGQRCQTLGTSGKVCVNVSTISSKGGKQTVNAVQICVQQTAGGLNNQGVKSSSINVGGTSYGLGNPGASSCYVTALSTVAVSPGFCWHARGLLVLNNWQDQPWEVSGQMQGGAC